MTDHVIGKNKKKTTAPEEKSLAEKYLEDKKNAALGIAPSHQFGRSTPMTNRPGFGGKPGGGKPAIRKHAARSR